MHGATMLLERLARQHLGEEVRGVVGSRNVLDRHHSGATQLAHLVELAVDVPRASAAPTCSGAPLSV